MWRFDHIGLVVRDLAAGADNLLATLPIVQASQRFDDHKLGVSVQFFRDTGGQVFELIAPLGPKSPVATLAASKLGKIDQLCYRCETLSVAVDRLRKNRCVPLGRAVPALAFDGAKVQFFWTPNDFVLELIEGLGDKRVYSDVASSPNPDEGSSMKAPNI
jgi:methylmalonyl-CoA/ethylmalonyl-CoA epimerase